MYLIRHFSGARNCDELASNFSCKFLVTVSVTCVAGFTAVAGIHFRSIPADHILRYCNSVER